MSTNHPIQSGPIFIGGPDRCGKTTMQAFLTSHPRISIPDVGSNMWTYFYGQFGDLGRGDHFERCLDAMLRYKHVQFLQPDPDRIRREFWQGEPTYARLFALFQMHHAERAGKPRWGVQTGLIERYADPITAAYPHTKFIHMVRDPRDRYHASLTLWPDGKGRAGGAAARWWYSMALARRNLRKFPTQVKLVPFEALVRQPEATLRDVCAFLGEAFDPAMLTMSGAPERRARLLSRARAVSGTTAVSGPTPLSDEFIGAYREHLSTPDIAFLQLVLGRQMQRFGYTADPTLMPTRQWLRCLVRDWPLDLARMGAWLAVERTRHHFPRFVGRKPDPRLIKPRADLPAAVDATPTSEKPA